MVENQSSITSARKRLLDERNPILECRKGNEAAEKEKEKLTEVKNIKEIVLGNYSVDTWYFAPFSGSNKLVECMYICQNCLQYTNDLRKYFKHQDKCEWTEPPGAEIYHDGNVKVSVDGEEKLTSLKVFEVDGWANIAY